MTDLIRGERPALTFWEQALRVLAGILALVSVGFAVIYVVKGFTTDAQYPYVTNSVAKDLLLMGLALLIIWDVRRWAAAAVPLIVAAHVVMPIVLTATSWWGNDKGIDHTWISPEAGFRTQWLIADVAMSAGFLFLHSMAMRSRYDVRYLTPSAFRALMALSEVLVLRKDRQITPAEVAGRVDHYLASFRAKDKIKVWFSLLWLAYWPLGTLRPPFHLISVDARQAFVQRRFLDEVRFPIVPKALRHAVIRAAQQFCFMGYYGDERAAKWAGYIPFSKRKIYTEAMEKVDPDRRGVTCMDPADIPGEDITADVVIVGTGAAGATLAYELARRGREVLLLERGAHVDPRDFTENEAEQLSNLYADGALTLSKDMQFQVAQGMCVGGSTVVNNAVCFDLPDAVRDRWMEPDGLNAGLDEVRLALAFDRVRKFLRVTPVGPMGVLNPGAWRLVDLGSAAPWPFTSVDCNIDGCLGSGYCNIGCAYGKKLSALDWTLPLAQDHYGDRVRILADCRVDKVHMAGPRADRVEARLGDGRRLRVHADTVVLSAGAIASSLILQRSGLGDGKAGKRLAFNMASPVTVDFHPEILHSERGMQISHYIEPQIDGHGGLALETWFNPIVSQSLFMPGWFEEHWDNMRHYASMTCIGVVVGTKGNASVKAARLLGGVDLRYEPDHDDFVRLKEGLKLACTLGLRAKPLRVLPASFRTIDIRSEADLHRIDEEIGSHLDLSVNSAHPQGGNPMSDDPMIGVVDPRFRVYGTMNVHVCDASVFPSSITVNPQLTVMALAEYAADAIAGPRPGDDDLPQEPIVQVPLVGPGL